MKYLVSEIDDDACCEIPRYICNTRADAEELILALTEEDVYYQAMYSNIDKFFNHMINMKDYRSNVKCETNYGLALWLMSGKYFINVIGEY